MRLLIRADSTGMGIGHVMRCIALGQAWRDAGGRVDFVTRCKNEKLLNRLRKEEFEIWHVGGESEWDLFRVLTEPVQYTALILDGYDFDSEYQKRARSYFRPLLVVDDLANLPFYSADVVLNQNVHAVELSYCHDPDTRLLLGTRWALIRREFLKWQNWQRQIPPIARRVLVTMGGSDPINFTQKVIDAIRYSGLAKELEVRVVAGAGSVHVNKLMEQASETIQICSNVSDMALMMAWADMVVSGAGSTCLEAAFMGLPSLVVILADNQRQIAETLDRSAIAINLGRQEDLTSQSLAVSIADCLRASAFRQQSSRCGRRLVDGKGAAATVRIIQHLSGGPV
jgi:UDP-2,4-diacetamido-2,4,6-trideoxy-beta-L-altropyranose hydrolase